MKRHECFITPIKPRLSALFLVVETKFDQSNIIGITNQVARKFGHEIYETNEIQFSISSINCT